MDKNWKQLLTDLIIDTTNMQLSLHSVKSCKFEVNIDNFLIYVR